MNFSIPNTFLLPLFLLSIFSVEFIYCLEKATTKYILSLFWMIPAIFLSRISFPKLYSDQFYIYVWYLRSVYQWYLLLIYEFSFWFSYSIYLGYYPFGISFFCNLFFKFSIWVRYQSDFTFARDQLTVDDDVRVFFATTFTHLCTLSSWEFYPNTIFLPHSIINILIFLFDIHVRFR